MDANLLESLLAARRGFAAIIGWKQPLDARIAKSLTQRNTEILRIKRQLGHCIMAWDEEAVVHYPEEIYFARRIGRAALPLVDHVVAWGEDNRELLLGHPKSAGLQVSVLGNPRADLLRAEMHPRFAARADELRREHGEFMLVNTNFGSINGYADRLNLMREDPETGEWVQGNGSRGLPADYAAGLFDHRRNTFSEFQRLLPEVAAAFPGRTVILRPHPAENHEFWRAHLASYPNVRVLAEGNVVPWLKAAACLIHNGCTTAVEGFLMGTPIISFVPRPSERYDFHLPNRLGIVARDARSVIEAVRSPEPTPALIESGNALLDRYIHREHDQLASERIVDLIADLDGERAGERVPWSQRLLGRLAAEVRALVKVAKRKMGDDRCSAAFMRQRFPELSVEDVQARVQELAAIVGGDGGAGAPLEVRAAGPDLFEVSSS